jgi:type II secretory pathway component PulK
MSNKHPQMRRGGVLIVVLVMTAFIVSMVTLTFERSAATYTGVVTVQAENQGGIYAATAIEAIKTLMALDDANYDGANDMWATSIPLPVSGGFVTVTIKAADDRIPLSALTKARESAEYARVTAALDRLFTELELDTTLWHGIHDWMRPGDSEMLTMSLGEEFNREGNSYTAPHRPLESLVELRLVPDLAREYNRLSKYIAMGDTQPRININFAPPEVISAFLPELEPYVEQIVEQRATEPFTNKDALYAIMGNRDDYTKILPFFDVKSTLLYAKVEINLSSGNYYYHALFKRNGTSLSIVGYIEGGRTDADGGEADIDGVAVNYY